MKTSQMETLTPIDKALETLENLEEITNNTEKQAIIEVSRCESTKLFHLVSWSASYRATASSAAEIYPDDLQINTHDKNAGRILFTSTQNLVNKFEKECKCRKIYAD